MTGLPLRPLPPLGDALGRLPPRAQDVIACDDGRHVCVIFSDAPERRLILIDAAAGREVRRARYDPGPAPPAGFACDDPRLVMRGAYLGGGGASRGLHWIDPAAPAIAASVDVPTWKTTSLFAILDAATVVECEGGLVTWHRLDGPRLTKIGSAESGAPGEALCVAVDPARRHVYHAHTGERGIAVYRTVLDTGRRHVRKVDLVHAQRMLASDDGARLWVVDHRAVACLETGRLGVLGRWALGDDEIAVAISADGRALHLFDLEARTVRSVGEAVPAGAPRRRRLDRVSPCGTWGAWVFDQVLLRVDLVTGRFTSAQVGHAAAVFALGYAPSGRRREQEPQLVEQPPARLGQLRAEHLGLAPRVARRVAGAAGAS